MKIELDTKSRMGQTMLRLSHGNAESYWDISAYYQRSSEKSPALDDNSIFEEINAYWAQLNQDRQTMIWQTYQQARAVLDTHYDIDALRRPLQALAKQLYELMPMHEIAHWSRLYTRTRLPSNLKETYGDRDKPEQTYLREDYLGLVALAIALRPMLPIWGEYISSTAKEAGNAFKEYQALGLLHSTTLVKSQEYERLRQYVESLLESNQQQVLSNTAVLTGMGSAELPNWMLGLVVVRRLTVGQISAKEDNSSLITNIHQYINNTIKSQDRKLGTAKFGGSGKVTDKNRPENNPEDQKASVVELYKVKQEVSDGDLVILNYYTENPHALAAALAVCFRLDYDPALLDKCLHCVKALEHVRIEQHQETLTQWIVDFCIPARGVPQLEKPALLRTMAVTQTLMWQLGFYDLAALVTATPLTSGQDEMSTFAEGRARIPKEILEEFKVRWPHYRQGRGKQTTDRVTNPAAKGTDKLAHLLSANDWQLHAPTELVELTSRLPNTKRLKVPVDIRQHIGRFLLTFEEAQRLR